MEKIEGKSKNVKSICASEYLNFLLIIRRVTLKYFSKEGVPVCPPSIQALLVISYQL